MTETRELYITEKPYRKPVVRRMHPVSARELVLLNFIRNQMHRCQNGGIICVSLFIGGDVLRWRIDER